MFSCFYYTENTPEPQTQSIHRSIRAVQSRPCAATPPPPLVSTSSHNAEEPRSGYVLKFGPLDCSPGLSGKRRGGEKRRKGEEMMEGRPTIRVCFLACWGLQPNLLHLLANACRRVIRRVGIWGGGGGDLVRHLYRAQMPDGLFALCQNRPTSFLHSVTL